MDCLWVIVCPGSIQKWHPWHMVNERAVRILLECILVFMHFPAKILPNDRLSAQTQGLAVPPLGSPGSATVMLMGMGARCGPNVICLSCALLKRKILYYGRINYWCWVQVDKYHIGRDVLHLYRYMVIKETYLFYDTLLKILNSMPLQLYTLYFKCEVCGD